MTCVASYKRKKEKYFKRLLFIRNLDVILALSIVA